MMDLKRRNFLVGAAVAAAAVQTTVATAAVTPDPTPNSTVEVINLWSGTPPGGAGPGQGENLTPRGSLTQISQPRIIIHKPDKPTGAAMLMCSGGGYAKVDIINESTPAAVYFASRGITSIELVYRVPQEGWSIHAPFLDGIRAMRILHAEAGRLGIDPARLGVMGFSAGGHVAGMLATGAAEEFYVNSDEIDNSPSKVAFAALLYPVVTMMAPFDQTMSRLKICGKQPSQDMRETFSVEQHVTKDTPPTFIAHAMDDPIVPVDHSLMLFQALRSAKIDTELHIFQSGGHGWGMGKTRPSVRSWAQLVETWLRLNGMLSTV
ncbi:MAG: alpha/beta hydrolase [Rhizobium sp.]